MSSALVLIQLQYASSKIILKLFSEMKSFQLFSERERTQILIKIICGYPPHSILGKVSVVAAFGSLKNKIRKTLFQQFFCLIKYMDSAWF